MIESMMTLGFKFIHTDNMQPDFTEMPDWKLAMEVTEGVFIITNELPGSEDYILTSQLRRASVSTSGNIAGAFVHPILSGKNKLYDHAGGSAYQTKSLLFYGTGVGYFNGTTVEKTVGNLNSSIFNINKIKFTPTRRITQS